MCESSWRRSAQFRTYTCRTPSSAAATSNSSIHGQGGFDTLVDGAENNNPIDGIGSDTDVFGGLSIAHIFTCDGQTTSVMGPDGAYTLAGVEPLQIDDRSVRTLLHAETGLSDNGKSDILWRNNSSGADTIWKAGDSARVPTVTTGSDANWEISVRTNTGIV